MSSTPELPPDERELAELLRRAPAGTPDPAARARARAAFLAAADERSRPVGEARTGARMDPAEEVAFETWLRGALGRLPARPEARERARAVFLSSLASQRGPRPAFPRRLRLLALTLAAAGVLAVTFLLPEAPRWRVELFGPVAFEGEDFRLEDEQRLGHELERTGLLATPGGPARVALADALELELRPGAELRVPPLPELDGASPIVFELLRGEVFLRTRGGWRGNPLFVRTSFGDVRATGTVFGVLVEEGCMCVCVAEGAVQVEGGELSERVEARHLLQLTRRDDPAPLRMAFTTDPASPERAHLAPLEAFESEP